MTGGNSCTQRNWIIDTTYEYMKMADGKVSNTCSSSIPVNIAVKTNQNATFFHTLPEILPVENLRHVHSWIKSLFFENIPSVLLARKIKHFIHNSRSKYEKILTQDQNMLSV